MCPFEKPTNNVRIYKRRTMWYLSYRCDTGNPYVKVRSKVFHTSDEAFEFYCEIVDKGRWPTDEPVWRQSREPSSCSSKSYLSV